MSARSLLKSLTLQALFIFLASKVRSIYKAITIQQLNVTKVDESAVEEEEEEEEKEERMDGLQIRKELEACVARNVVLEKENSELKQEVAKLRAQVSSLKAHDNERKSMLWKKLQNSMESCNLDVSNQKQNDFVKVQEQNPDGEGLNLKSKIQDFDMGKERSIKAPKSPPPRPNSIKVPISAPPPPPTTPKLAPPPPPLPSRLSSKSIRRVPEVVELYRSLTRKDTQMGRKSNNGGASPGIPFSKNMIGEIENRSAYLLAVSDSLHHSLASIKPFLTFHHNFSVSEQIKSDVKKQKEFINFLIKEVETAAFSDISEVETFVKWLDQELSSLVDERAVLKHFPNWPERKVDALREAACNYRDLKGLEFEVSGFQDNPKVGLVPATRKMQALQDRRGACTNFLVVM